MMIGKRFKIVLSMENIELVYIKKNVQLKCRLRLKLLTNSVLLTDLGHSESHLLL